MSNLSNMLARQSHVSCHVQASQRTRKSCNPLPRARCSITILSAPNGLMAGQSPRTKSIWSGPKDQEHMVRAQGPRAYGQRAQGPRAYGQGPGTKSIWSDLLPKHTTSSDKVSSAHDQPMTGPTSQQLMAWLDDWRSKQCMIPSSLGLLCSLRSCWSFGVHRCFSWLN